MKKTSRMKALADRFLTVPSDDPEVVRRARLLNICLLAVGTAAGLLTLVNLYELAALSDPTARFLVIYTALGVLDSIVAYWLNRRGWYRLAGYLFLLLIVYIITASTRPATYLFEGSTMLAYVLPIIMASVIMEPGSSFVITTVIVAVLYVIAKLYDIPDDPTPETVVTLYMLALVAWLSARSLSQALQQARSRAEELRLTNLELDKRVAERTRDLEQANWRLVDALGRQHAEADKNRAILAGIADGVIVFDEQRRALLVNPAIERMLAMPADSMLGKEITQLIEAQENADVRDSIAAAFRQDVSRPVRFNFEHGSQIIAASLAPVALPGEGIRGVAAVFHDVTREVEADRSKSEFVSTVSHELRTPLTSIKGYADLLFMGAVGEINPQQRGFLQIIKSNADRLTALINDLLDISRMETGRIRLDIKEVSMAEVVNDAVASLRPEIEKKGLRLTTAIAPDLRLVRGDRSRLAQVLTNLLSNAYHYTLPGGSIRVSVMQMDNNLRVDVADTGIGIAPQDQAKLFQRFFRADDARVREITGTGLGLAITKMFVELHGGRIWVQSELNKGSTFTVVLPTVQAPSKQEKATPTESAAPSPAKPPGVEKKILVVDDDRDIAELLRYHLEGNGYQVTVINLGREILPTALSEQPDVITLDILLPDADGFEILRELKENPATAGIPVIVLSVVHDRETGLQMGAADYLTKPIRGEELVGSIKRVLGERGAKERQQILVVDDEWDIRRWLRDALTLHGFQVTEASDGLEALQQVARSRPGLILLDLKMPRMDGRTVIKHLKSDKSTCDIPIIVLTASPINKERDELQLLSMGVERLLTKPISPEALVAEIQKQLAIRMAPPVKV